MKCIVSPTRVLSSYITIIKRQKSFYFSFLSTIEILFSTIK